ncbi:hypothetical protein D1BOALGB6SA_19 [Olavius sp. associated proteobacterium Delta 1]|nr:hypothetical protein D1BOALGB6SA_19 [Olavius sp. associated proteobacterium Delta 1]
MGYKKMNKNLRIGGFSLENSLKNNRSLKCT